MRNFLISAGAMFIAYGVFKGIDMVVHVPEWLRYSLGFALGAGAYELAWQFMDDKEVDEDL